MSDPAIVVACVATFIATGASALAWVALDTAFGVLKSHGKLRDEFWRQSFEQARENGHQWGFQIRQAEWLRALFERGPAPPRKQQPPN